MILVEKREIETKTENFTSWKEVFNSLQDVHLILEEKLNELQLQLSEEVSLTKENIEKINYAILSVIGYLALSKISDGQLEQKKRIVKELVIEFEELSSFERVDYEFEYS